MASRVDHTAEAGVHQSRAVRLLTVIAVVLLTLSVAAEVAHTPEARAGKWSSSAREATYQRVLAAFVASNGERTGVVDRHGEIVGFIRAADLLGDIFETPAEIVARAGAPGSDRTPVWGHDDETLVGYMIVDVGYRSLAELAEP